MSRINDLLDNTDEQTREYVMAAKSMIANNHGLAVDRNPAEIMRENNQKLHEAARVIKKRTGMVRQKPVQKKVEAVPETPVPVVQTPPVNTQVINDNAMQAQGYDRYMESMMSQQNVPQQPVQQPIQQPVQQPVQQAEPQATITIAEPPKYPDNFVQNSTAQVEQVAEPEQPTELSQFAEPQFADRHSVHVSKPEFQPRPFVMPQQPPKPQQREILLPPELSYVPPDLGVAAPPPQYYQFNVNPPEQVIAQKVRNFDAFSEIRGLPSQGALYGGPITGQAYKLMDLLVLNDLDMDNVSGVFNELYARRLRGIEPEDILSADDPYILHWLRASSFPDQPLPGFIYFDCPECGKHNEAPKNSNGFPVSFYNLQFDIVGDLKTILAKHATGYYAFTLPDGRECDVYLRRRSHDRQVEEAKNAYKRDTGRNMPTYLLEIVKTAVILEIEECETLNEKIDYLGSMNVNDAGKMFEEINNASLMTMITAKMKCPKCGKEVYIPYPFRLEQYISSL